MLFAIVPSSYILNGTFAGYNIPENSPYNIGMTEGARTNSYWYPDAFGYDYSVYDYPGSIQVPTVNAYEPVNKFSGPGAGILP
ncbi:hypothetical protein GUITHDRAFT_111193 [Guillardia theta CCMP2712]|uniref:Uncharacterized protein n=1 Tax=Guillardia theta (strain CCMP2712) TaxID=905079 RepID=L1J2S9_GUITC|nr:hypothetical protein GUITHDRAFT_111193 [Guillardia theta CCMP2712]EKX42823.1 hypothetical protein GUITHDRAFT_111193 [Guillardia theta CCMP2712]|eukprot:XP_005829803.1 hypothetical protein GUITHDRAFT_111193 [Guillardia theta CCMP2712]